MSRNCATETQQVGVDDLFNQRKQIFKTSNADHNLRSLAMMDCCQVAKLVDDLVRNYGLAGELID